jgi:hypothetical protein
VRRRTVTAIALAAVVAAGATGCTSAPPAGSSAVATITATTSAAASTSVVASPSASAIASAEPPVPTFALTLTPAVTADRLLRVSDNGGRPPQSGVAPVGAAFIAGDLSPPCATAAPNEAALAERVSISLPYRASDSNISPDNDVLFDGAVNEILSRYQPGGAAQFLAAWKTAVAACPHEEFSATRTVSDHTVVGTGFAGPDSVLVRTISGGPPDQPYSDPQTSYVAVIRSGDVIILLSFAGYEGGSASRTDVDRLIGAALTRATA